MKDRKCCEVCHKPFIAFQGHYLHVEEPCNSIRDGIFIQATIQDELVYNKFIETYGKPDMDDYERLAFYEKKLSNPFIRFILRFL